MLNRILAFFENSSEQESEHKLTVDESASVLLIEIMLADNDLDLRERDCVAQILAHRTGGSEDSVSACIDAAMARHEQSHDLFQFTSVINDNWSEDQRFMLLVDMWKVAFADGRLDKYEDHRIRRVAELLHLHHSHFIKAKSIAKSTD